MTNTITILAIAIVGLGIPSAYACAPEDVQHWNEIRFIYGAVDLVSDTEPELDENTFYNIWIQRDGEGISSLRQVLVDQLTALGYVEKLSGDPPTPNRFSLVDAEYSSFCNDFDIAQIVGGMLIQPDSTAMFLAYGIANAIWLAPTILGLGAGIYLTKNKWKR